MNNSSQSSVSERDVGFAVKWVGAQRNVLQGDISGPIALTSLSGLQNLYAVGPVERIQGQISIFDSVPWISRITDGALNIETDSNVSACFLVYAQVSAWHRVTISTVILDETTLETYMVKFASELGIDVSQPLPFLINATPRPNYFLLELKLVPGICDGCQKASAPHRPLRPVLVRLKIRTMFLIDPKIVGDVRPEADRPIR